MNSRRKTLIATVFTGALVLMASAGPSAAQSDSASDIRRCLTISDDAARIRCYDNVARALGGEPLLPAPAPLAPASSATAEPLRTVPVTAAPTETGDRVATYGLPPARVEGEDEYATLHDRIADIDRGGFGTYVVTLASGQVWKQTSPQEYQMKKGQDVTIRATSWGSDYRLHADGSPGHIQVRRVN